MAPATKDKAIQLIIAAILSLIAGGSGSAVVNHEIISRVAVAETKLQAIEKDSDRVMNKLDEIQFKIEKGDEYIRDNVVTAISDLKVELASLKSRR